MVEIGHPKNAANEIREFETFLSSLSGEVEIASVIGRYFAMDRDKRWERTEDAYKLFFEGKADSEDTSLQSALAKHYEADVTDEFIRPVKLQSKFSDRPAQISKGDGVIFYNFRADRMRQIVSVTLGEVSEFQTSHKAEDINLATLTSYDEDYNIDVLFPPLKVREHLGEVASSAGLRQLRLAETEKYPHVTYFFNGGEETATDNEERAMVPSPRDVATYDLKPEMSVFGVTEKLISALNAGECDLAIVNFANCDMVGHTGVFEAALKAVEAVDQCLGQVLDCLEAVGGAALITADHGNSEQMIDYDTGEPHTFHTTYPVPIFYFGKNSNVKLRDGGALCDIAPTILDLLGLEKSPEMTGSSLLTRD